jgi:hypothetical protein
MLTASQEYFTAAQLTSITAQLGCDAATCTRSTATHTPLYIGSLASDIGPALTDVCSPLVCGINTGQVMGYACGKGAAGTTSANQWDREGCFSWIGLASPVGTAVDCYTPPASDACRRAGHFAGWVCRAPDVEFVDWAATAAAAPPTLVYGSNMTSAWAQCNSVWGDYRYIPNDLTANPPTYHPLRRDQVRCDQDNVLLARVVRCGVPGGAVFFKDGDCQEAKPPSTTRSLAGQANKCDYLAYHDAERLSPDAAFPPSPALTAYTYYSDDINPLSRTSNLSRITRRFQKHTLPHSTATMTSLLLNGKSQRSPKHAPPSMQMGLQKKFSQIPVFVTNSSSAAQRATTVNALQRSPLVTKPMRRNHR